MRGWVNAINHIGLCLVSTDSSRNTGNRQIHTLYKNKQFRDDMRPSQVVQSGMPSGKYILAAEVCAYWRDARSESRADPIGKSYVR